MVKESPVRIATVKDEPEILRLLHMMHEESGLTDLDVDAARETFSFAFKKKGGIIGVIGDSDKIEAAIFLLITRFWYRRKNHLEELFNYVHPDHRRSGHARTLIKFAKKCVDEIGIPLHIGVLTNKRMVEKVRLYRMSLGLPCGAFFMYGETWQNERPTTDDWWSVACEHAPGRDRRTPKGARVVNADTIAALGAGDVERGRWLLDAFIRTNAGG